MQKIKNTGALKALAVFFLISAVLFLLFQYTSSTNEGSKPKNDPVVTTKTDPLVTKKTENKTSVIASKTVRQNDSTLEEGKTTVKKKGQKKPVDTTAPIITLLGNTTENVANEATYTDAGATATDDVDGDITARIAVAGDTVNTAVAGTYVVTYNVSDAAGNAATEVTRTIIVSEAIKVSWITATPTFVHSRESFPTFIHVTIFPENATNKNVVWSSSNTSVVTVVDGEVTLRDDNFRGLVIITATTIDGSKTARALVFRHLPQAEEYAYWRFNDYYRGNDLDTFDLTKEEDLHYLEARFNTSHFDNELINLPGFDGKDDFVEIFTSFRTKLNVARTTFNHLQIEKAIELISEATYTMTQETAINENTVKYAIERKIQGEISVLDYFRDDRAPIVNKVEYTPAVAGDAAEPAGINGTYSFTVEVSNSSATGSTATLTMTIIATPFVDRP